MPGPLPGCLMRVLKETCVLANTEQPAPWGQKSQSVVRADSYGVCTPAMAGFQPPTLTAVGSELRSTITPVL